MNSRPLNLELGGLFRTSSVPAVEVPGVCRHADSPAHGVSNPGTNGAAARNRKPIFLEARPAGLIRPRGSTACLEIRVVLAAATPGYIYLPGRPVPPACTQDLPSLPLFPSFLSPHPVWLRLLLRFFWLRIPLLYTRVCSPILYYSLTLLARAF
ncbi:uncharacterized protein VTP21DRAFT_1188 [Calcarisporiella thermophila]|uniref:uncharacterized protein n=1 Tax=Calcarisporiella thermophila TaxID=911321 RepID=UPI0037448068